MQEESEAFEIFSDMYHKRLDALYELDLKEGRTDLVINKKLNSIC